MTSLSLMKWHKASFISSHELTSIGECRRCAIALLFMEKTAKYAFFLSERG